mmetsp:Transcript_8860/g.10939  ORF Transcript_8860/g.10939 Transcript_8860/m.10939 type:complete len:220 (-) Transcript_8860:291-950(-)
MFFNQILLGFLRFFLFMNSKELEILFSRLSDPHEKQLQVAECLLAHVEGELKGQRYEVPVKSYKNFSFLHVQKIVPFPHDMMRFIEACVKYIPQAEFFQWMQKTNPYPTSLLQLPVPSDTPLYVHKLNDIHVSIDQPPQELIGIEFPVEISHLSVYPLSEAKLGVSSCRINKKTIFKPMAWCTLEVTVPGAEGKLEPRNHSHYHISFAQIGYTELLGSS